MKKTTFLFVMFLFFSFATIAQTTKATVRKIEGIPIFILNEPDASYTVIGKVSDQDAVSIMNAVSGTATIRSIIEQAQIIIRNAQRKQKKGKIDDFDAIIIDDDGHIGTCIKFK